VSASDSPRWTDVSAILRYYPSPHNTQPYRLRPTSETEAEIVLLCDRLLPEEDHGNLYLMSTFGIFAAALRATGKSLGREIDVTRRRAAAVYYHALRRVPAYQRFLETHGKRNVSSWSDVPVTTKDNYIKAYRLEETLVDGQLPARGAVIDESSGSTGTASNWVRGSSERHSTRKLIQFSARATFGSESFILLNAFALGPWATGMNVSMSLVDECVLKSIGPDAAKVISTLKLLGPRYKYVITGYPPFLKMLVETADLDWKEYDVCAVVGGEGISEPMRAALNRCFTKTISSFGASDLEINLAVETDFSLALRACVQEKPEIGQELYGGGPVPMIFQYDPLNVLIENGSDQHLLFTLNRLENVSPRIRYDLKDRGSVLPMSKAQATLRKHGVELAPRAKLPLLFHWGRLETAVAFYGCKITPEDIENAIFRTEPLNGRIEHFALHPFEDAQANKRLELWFEIKDGAATPENTSALAQAFLDQLAHVNQDFRESIRMVAANMRPELRFWPAGQSPMSGQDVRIKRRYIL
jgi:phenylacetate-CoA ligase